MTEEELLELAIDNVNDAMEKIKSILRDPGYLNRSSAEMQGAESELDCAITLCFTLKCAHDQIKRKPR